MFELQNVRDKFWWNSVLGNLHYNPS